jgi:hypothetical protein
MQGLGLCLDMVIRIQSSGLRWNPVVVFIFSTVLRMMVR